MGVRPTAWLLGALAVGSVVACDPLGWWPFGPAKWLVVVTLGGVVVAAAVSPIVGPVRLPRRERVVLLAFLALVGLAAAGGADGWFAWLGTAERRFGALTWFLAAGAYAAGRTLRGHDDRCTVARSMVVAALALGAWSVAEVVGGPLIGLATETRRLTGPYGSAAYLGASAALFGGVAATVALDRSETRGWRVTATIATAGAAVALLGSGARAAWLGAAAAGATALVARLRHRRRPAGTVTARAPRQTGGRAVAGLVALVGVVALAVAPRLGDVLERSDGAASRLDEWRVAVRVIVEQPLLGAGPEGYRLVFAAGVDDRYEQRYGRAVLPDRAHSGPLDVAVTLGLPGLALWLAAVGFVARRAWWALRAGPSAAAALALGWLAHLVQQLALFPVMELEVTAWALAGVLVAWRPAHPDPQHRPVHHTSAEPNMSAPATVPVVVVNTFGSTEGHGAPGHPGGTRRRVAALVTAGTLAFTAVLFVGAVRDVAGDRLARRAADALAMGRTGDAVAHGRRAVAMSPHVLRVHLLLAAAHEAGGTLAGLDRAIAETLAAQERSPRDPVVAGELARRRSVRAGVTGTAADTYAALDAWRVLVERDPHHAAWQLGLGLAATRAGDVELAERALVRAVELAPGDAVAADALARLRELRSGG